MSSKKGFFYTITALHPEVTGSCLLVTVHYPDGNIMMFIVDCGLFQERPYKQLNSQTLPFTSSKIAFALITHNHADHNGRLPILMKEGFKGKIYTTATTKRHMQFSLMDDYKIMLSNAKEKKQKPWYSEEDIYKVMENTECCPLEETVYVNPNVKVTFLDNGHLLGSASIFVQISCYGEDDLNILFTGDCKPTTIWKEIRPIPEWIRELPKTVVTESTYGYMDSNEVEYHFESDIQKILSQGKSITIFVFAQGRAQEVLYVLKTMQDGGRLSKKIPIYLDGKLAQINTKMYQNSEEIDEDKRNFIPENFTLVNKENRQNVISETKQKIILTTSGMADHGPACIYVPEFVSRYDMVFYFSGYVSKDSFANKIMNPKDGKITIKGKDYDVNVDVYSTSEFSSHAKADEMIAKLKEAGNVQLVLINHGQKESQQIFAQKIINAEFTKRVEILSEHSAVVGKFGLIKIMGSKIYSVKMPKEDNSTEKYKKEGRIPVRKRFNSYFVCKSR